MDNNICMKIANEVCDNLIELWKNNKTKNKNIIDLFNQLLDKKYSDNKYLILSYIPEILSKRGYEIVNSEFFELKKY